MLRRSQIVIGGGLLALFLGASLGRADVPAITLTGFGNDDPNNGNFSMGYTFSVSSPITISALGALDVGGDSIAATQSFPVNLYYSTATPSTGGISIDGGHESGDLVAGGSALVSATDPIESIEGGTYTTGDGFRYHTLASPITLAVGTYAIQDSQFGTGFGINGQGITNVPGVSGPLHLTFVAPDNSASYPLFDGPDGDLPGGFGPNFLVTPEPASGLFLMILGAAFVRRRSRA